MIVLLWFLTSVQWWFSRWSSVRKTKVSSGTLNQAQPRSDPKQKKIREFKMEMVVVCSMPHSSTFSTRTWTDSSSSPVSAFAFFVVSVSLSRACGSWGFADLPVWPCQTLLSDFFGSEKSTPCRPQLQSPEHNPGHLLRPQVAPDIWPSQWESKEKSERCVNASLELGAKNTFTSVWQQCQLKNFSKLEHFR